MDTHHPTKILAAIIKSGVNTLRHRFAHWPQVINNTSAQLTCYCSAICRFCGFVGRHVGFVSALLPVQHASSPLKPRGRQQPQTEEHALGLARPRQRPMSPSTFRASRQATPAPTKASAATAALFLWPCLLVLLLPPPPLLLRHLFAAVIARAVSRSLVP